MTQQSRNRIFFGLGTFGRDMSYTLVSMYLIFFLTDVLNLPDETMWGATIILTALRVFDALNDPFMGLVVDNTRSRFGKFKPGMLIGAVTGAALTLLMFSDLGLTGAGYLALFGLCYLLWDILYGINDIAYWSMLPALSVDQGEREKAGAFAKVCASLGMYLVVVGCVPLTAALAGPLGGAKQAWFALALITALLMVLFQLFTIIGVRENRAQFREEEKTGLRDMWRVLAGNDQLMYTALSMGLFMIGYTTTTTFGIYFFKYAYGDEGMYPLFAMILGVAQLGALLVFPLVARRTNRRRLYLIATVLVLLGYLVFFFSPMHMLFIGLAGLLLFIGQSFINVLMMMFLTDTIEYGQWKLGRRNEAISFSVQPLINKIGGAAANGIVGVTLILSGINRAQSAAEVSPDGLQMMKAAMLLLPMLCILLGYVVYRRKFKIDEAFHKRIVEDLKARGDLRD